MCPWDQLVSPDFRHPLMERHQLDALELEDAAAPGVH